MGPRGLGPNHFSSLSQNYFVFSGFWASQKNGLFKKIGVFLMIFAILANVDVNLRLQICKIAI